MKIKELLKKVQIAHDKNPDAKVGIWIWENYGTSPNYDSCIAEEADITEKTDAIFGGAFVISCDKRMQEHKQDRK